MSKLFSLTILTPGDTAYAGAVSLFGADALDGRVAFMAGAAPRRFAVRAGIVSLYETDSHILTRRFEIGGGVCEVSQKSGLLLVDAAQEIVCDASHPHAFHTHRLCTEEVV